MAQSSWPWAGSTGPAEWPFLSLPAVRWAVSVAAVAIAGAWIGYYLITQPPYLVLESFRATVAFHAVTAVIFIPYCAYLIVARRLPGGSPLDLPIVALLGVYLLATAASLDWRVSLEVTLTALMAIGVFYVLSDGLLLSRRQLEAALMLAVLAAAAWALWQVASDYADWLRLTNAVRGGVSAGDLIPPTVPKVHSVGDHPNLLGGIFAMTLPFFFAGLFRRLPAPLRVALALAGATVALAMFFALARSAWLGAGAGLAVTTALIFATPAGVDRVRGLLLHAPGRRWIAAALAAAAIVVVAVGAVYVATSVQSRPIWLFRDSGTPRLDVIEAGGAMVRDHPLLGTGPGLYSLLYPQYSGRFPNHAFHSHNGFLQTAVDLGVPGVLAMFALAGALGWLLYRGLRETEDDARISLAACAGALAAFAVFSLFDAPNSFKGPLVALAAVGAVAALSYQERRPLGLTGLGWPAPGRRVQPFVRAIVPVAMLGLLITWGRLDTAHYFYSEGVSNANAGQWTQAIHDASHAVDLDPHFAVYRLELGTIEGQAYLDTHDPQLYSDAVYQLQRAVGLEPRSAIGHANLALLLAQSPDRDATRSEALAALRYANSDPAVVVAAATALEKASWQEDAVLAYAQALYLDINLADSPFWSESAFRVSHFGEIVGRSAVVFNTCGVLRLYASNVPAIPLSRDEALSDCGQWAIRHPNDSAPRVALAEAFIADHKYDEARTHIDYALAREPDYGPARTMLGRWYAAQGQIESARREWLRAGQLGEVEALVLLGDSYPSGQVPPAVVGALRNQLTEATSQVQFHLTGILYYRFKFFRGSPVAILLPGEWQRAIPARYAEARDALARWTGQSSP